MLLSLDESLLAVDFCEFGDNIVWVENHIRNAISHRQSEIKLTMRSLATEVGMSVGKLQYQLDNSVDASLTNLLIIAGKLEVTGKLSLALLDDKEDRTLEFNISGIENYLIEFERFLATVIANTREREKISIRKLADLCGLTLGKMRYHI